MSILDKLRNIFKKRNYTMLTEGNLVDDEITTDELKAYNEEIVDFSIKIGHGNRSFKVKKRTPEEREQQIKVMGKKATRADRIIKWMKTGEKTGLKDFSDEQLNAIKVNVQKFQHDMKRDGIDTDSKMEVLAYIYCKLQTSILYKSPMVLRGDWGEDVGNNNIYGGLVEKYSPCGRNFRNC